MIEALICEGATVLGVLISLCCLSPMRWLRLEGQRQILLFAQDRRLSKPTEPEGSLKAVTNIAVERSNV